MTSPTPLLLAGAMFVLLSNACSTSNCLATCLDGTITFKLTVPLEGQDVTITVMHSSSSPMTLDCRSADGPVDCTPPSAVVPHFAASGALQSVEVPILGAGQYRIQIAVDGTQVIDERYQYELARVAGVCGSSCYPNATVDIPN